MTTNIVAYRSPFHQTVGEFWWTFFFEKHPAMTAWGIVAFVVLLAALMIFASWKNGRAAK